MTQKVIINKDTLYVRDNIKSERLHTGIFLLLRRS